MNLTHLSDIALDESLVSNGKKFKAAQSLVLFHLVEVEKRKLHLSLGFSSLQNYVQEKLELDGGSAQRLIDTARLHLAVPTVIDRLHNKELTQAQVSFLQKSFRQIKTKVPKEVKAKLIEEIKNKSVSETQVIVSKALNLEILESPKVNYQQNGTVNFHCPLKAETFEKLEEMRELLSTAVPNGEWDEVFNYIADKVKASKLPKKPMSQVQINDGAVSAEANRQVIHRDKCCQFTNKLTGRKCKSLWNLQVDHIKPRWAGGDNSLENLRALCANHNRMIYRSQAGIRNI